MAKSTRKISVYTHIIDLLKQSRIMVLNILVRHIRFQVGDVCIFCVRWLEQIEKAADVLLHQILLSAVPDYLYFVGCHPIEVLRELLCFRKDLFFNFCLGSWTRIVFKFYHALNWSWNLGIFYAIVVCYRHVVVLATFVFERVLLDAELHNFALFILNHFILLFRIYFNFI